MKKFELVIPAYNEGKTLPLLIKRAQAAAVTSGFGSEDFCLVVVDNGSKDDTASVLNKLQASELGPWFRVVTVVNNQGYGFGLMSGLRETTAPIVGWSHADMQCDPLDAFTAFRVLEKAPAKTLVKGTRSGRNWKDRVVTDVFELLARHILNVPIEEINAQPKVFHRQLLDLLEDPPNTFAFDLYVLFCALKAGYGVETIPVVFPPRIHGVSNWASNFFSRYRTILGMVKYMCVLRTSQR